MWWQSLIGLCVIPILAWVISEDRSKIQPRLVITGIAMQIALAILLLKFPLFHNIFIPINQANTAISKAATAGTSFVFGFLGGGPQPFTITNPSAGLILAFQVLPLVLVISALSSLLFYWRILPLIVRGLAWILQHTLGIGGALGLATAANVFVGMVEAPLFIRPYLKAMTRGELFAVMTAGMATVAGTVMLLYAKILTSVIPNAINHIVTASIISAPAALTIAAIMVPLGNTATAGNIINVNNAQSSMDAITRGTMDGLNLFLNILALLLVLVALVDLSNQIIGLLPNMYDQPITIQRILGWIMAPLMWLIGIPWAEAQTAGTLMGTKTVLNELLAYLDLSQLPTNALSTRSRLIIIYALCGFANFGSLGIMLGGMGTMVPERRTEIISLGVKSMLSGTLATCMTGAVVGLIV